MPTPTLKHPLIYQCPFCKSLTPLTQFSTMDEGILITCDRCQTAFLIPSPSSERGPSLQNTSPSKKKKSPQNASTTSTFLKNSPSSPEDEKIQENSDKKRCPKCGYLTEQTREDCPKCGLAFENVGVTWELPEISAPSTPQEEAAQKLWEEILIHWNEDSPHEKFVRFCIVNDLFDFAAIRYNKEKLKRNDKRAAQQLEALALLAQQTLMTMNSDEEKKSSSSTSLHKLLITLFIVAGGIMLYFLLKNLFSVPPLP